MWIFQGTLEMFIDCLKATLTSKQRLEYSKYHSLCMQDNEPSAEEIGGLKMISWSSSAY